MSRLINEDGSETEELQPYIKSSAARNKVESCSESFRVIIELVALLDWRRRAKAH